MAEKMDLDDLERRIGVYDGLNIDEAMNLVARIRALESASQPGGGEAVDVHSILRYAEEQKAARAKQLPTDQDCIRMMVQIRLRLQELGWGEACYAPKDGSKFEAIVAGYVGPSECVWLGAGFFVFDRGDLWPAEPFMFRKMPTLAAPSAGNGETKGGRGDADQA